VFQNPISRGGAEITQKKKKKNTKRKKKRKPKTFKGGGLTTLINGGGSITGSRVRQAGKQPDCMANSSGCFFGKYRVNKDRW